MQVKFNDKNTGIYCFDDVLLDSDIDLFLQEIKDFPFYFGETDGPGGIETGLICELDKNLPLSQYLIEKACSNFEILKSLEIYRIYINLFKPAEDANFHIDGEEIITCLFYMNRENNINEGGETQFLIEDFTVGIRSIPGRLCLFPGKILHKATPFRAKHRFTVALKFFADKNIIAGMM